MSPRALIILLLASASPSVARAEGPSAHELAAILVDHDAAPIVRHVRCDGGSEEPTEFHCRYQQRDAFRRWVTWSIYVAIDGDHWVVIDEPAKEGRSN